NPDAFYNLNQAGPQHGGGDSTSDARPRERYVKTDPIKSAVRGREADVVRGLGIAWHGRDHIHCPYPDHPDRNPSWRLKEDGNAVCTCSPAHSVFDVVTKMEGGDFESAKIRVAELLGLNDLIVDPNGDQGLTVEK